LEYEAVVVLVLVVSTVDSDSCADMACGLLLSQRGGVPDELALHIWYLYWQEMGVL